MDTAATYRVLNVDTSVDNVCTCAFTGALIVDISSGTRLAARQPGQSPIRIALGSLNGHDGVLLDVFDLEARQGSGFKMRGLGSLVRYRHSATFRAPWRLAKKKSR